MATLLASFCTSTNCTCCMSSSKNPSTSAGTTPRIATFPPRNAATSNAAVAAIDHGSGATNRRLGMKSLGQRAMLVRRTALMMRESTAPPTGSLRSSRRRLSMNGSRSGSTVDLLQELAQSIAGAQHAHLERRNADARQLRHLLVAQILHVLHQKSFPLV